jgi:hypothetical protein
MAPRYDDELLEGKRRTRDWRPPPDPRLAFQEGLQALLDDEGTIAGVATWERLAKLVARHWQAFPDQSPLSTWNMLAKCGEMVLKVKLASRKGGGDDERVLQEYEQLMREVFAPETDEERQARVVAPAPPMDEPDWAEDDEDEEDD